MHPRPAAPMLNSTLVYSCVYWWQRLKLYNGTQLLLHDIVTCLAKKLISTSGSPAMNTYISMCVRLQYYCYVVTYLQPAHCQLPYPVIYVQLMHLCRQWLRSSIVSHLRLPNLHLILLSTVHIKVQSSSSRLSWGFYGHTRERLAPVSCQVKRLSP